MTITDAARYWATVPSADDEGPDLAPAGRNASRSLGRMKPSRRTMFKTAGALGGALAINILSALPPGRGTTASAVVGNEYTSCAGYGEWPGYDNNKQACVGAPYSRNNCGSDGWFQVESGGACYSSYPIKACGDGSLTKRNAWRWTHSSTPYRCADGIIDNCGARDFRICSWSNP